VTIDNNDDETFASTTNTQDNNQSHIDTNDHDIEMKDSDNPRGYRHSDFKKAAG
jgi:hypothetical protein